MAVTITDVAQRAGVSRSTVSYVLSGSRPISTTSVSTARVSGIISHRAAKRLADVGSSQKSPGPSDDGRQELTL